jgi:spore coat polysaccharide biosynthesis protein SpsF
MTHTTEQEAFWHGEFGNAYADRNKGPDWVGASEALFAKVLGGAGDINEKAAAELKAALPEVELHLSSILEFEPRGTWDLVFTKGVLIHIIPDKLPIVYEVMYRSSARFVLLAEYYNPKPVEISYRGHSGKLFKRDFAGEMLDMFPNLSLRDYGFAWHRDPSCPQDDLTWFLLERK